MNEKMGEIIYWVIFIIGLLSFAIILSVEYGIIYTMIITSICGVYDLILAWVLRRKYLMLLSILLIASPYIVILVIWLN